MVEKSGIHAKHQLLHLQHEWYCKVVKLNTNELKANDNYKLSVDYDINLEKSDHGFNGIIPDILPGDSLRDQCPYFLK